MLREITTRLPGVKAGVEKRVHPHGFRHGWALGQVESGTSLPIIQQLLGHFLGDDDRYLRLAYRTGQGDCRGDKQDREPTGSAVARRLPTQSGCLVDTAGRRVVGPMDKSVGPRWEVG